MSFYKKQLDNARKAVLDQGSAYAPPKADQRVKEMEQGLMRRARAPQQQEAVGGFAQGLGMQLMSSLRPQARPEDAQEVAPRTPASGGGDEAYIGEGGSRPVPRPGSVKMSERELLARTLQAEALNQGLEGMVDVGAVIANRGASGRWGSSLSDVILARGQFSAWNSTHVNPMTGEKRRGYAGGEQGQNMLTMSVKDSAYAAADRILSGDYTDRTGGATHYVNHSVSQPAWLPQMREYGARQIGAHLFGNPDNRRTYDGKSWITPSN